MESHLVVFRLANEFYAVSIAAVSEIIMLQPITYVPRAPAFVEGVTNLRGKVLPVIDLRKRFGLPRGQDTKDTRIVVAEINHTLVGMVVDAVSQVLRVPEGAIEPPSPVVTTVDSAFISGIAKVANQLIILLDLEKILLPGEKADLQKVALQQTTAAAPLAGAPSAPAPAGPEPSTPAQELAPEDLPSRPAAPRQRPSNAGKKKDRRRATPPADRTPPER
jgi:purine-binding chemotaxis protein CheW